jgi:hypothetical protein
MKIKYYHAMLENINERSKLSLKEYQESDIPENILSILKMNKHFKSSKIFGDKDLGEPIEYEKLVVSKDGEDDKVFEYYNKGIHYMMYGGENEKPIFQMFAHFMMRDKK